MSSRGKKHLVHVNVVLFRAVVKYHKSGQASTKTVVIDGDNSSSCSQPTLLLSDINRVSGIGHWH